MKVIILFVFIITAINARPQESTGQTTVTSTTATPTTDSPRFLTCWQSCPSTMQYNPVCGTDGVNYHNSGRLDCARRCGKGCIAFIMWVGAFPNNRNPNLEYEFIDTNKPSPNSNKQPELFPLTTDRSIPVAISTTPLPESDGTTFIYNPQTKTWTQLKKNEFPPSKDALLWNQSQDKWLTQVPG
uniref:Kazal-like domain-containing protein n=1 Tax=Glossina palpalis gambiensis TaxID=67801 RepID=A0A1B0BMT6_9MUSC